MNPIKFQDKSDEVKILQDKLILLGYSLKADKDFGQKTLTAINNFQKLNNLPTTDFVDETLSDLIDADVKENDSVDKPSMKKILTLHPKIRFEVLHLFKECNNKGLTLRIAQGYRTFAEQDALYAQGRTKPGPIVTKAKAGLSNHNYGLSFDFCLLRKDGSISWSLTEDLNDDGNKDWMQIVEIFQSHGYTWGGLWKFTDNPHIEKTFGNNIRSLYKLYTESKVDADGYVII